MCLFVYKLVEKVRNSEELNYVLLRNLYEMQKFVSKFQEIIKLRVNRIKKLFLGNIPNNEELKFFATRNLPASVEKKVTLQIFTE